MLSTLITEFLWYAIMVKHHDQKWLLEQKSLFCLTVNRGRVHNNEGGMAPEGGQSKKLRDHQSHTESREGKQEVGQGYKHSNSSPSDIPAKGSLTFPNLYQLETQYSKLWICGTFLALTE